MTTFDEKLANKIRKLEKSSKDLETACVSFSALASTPEFQSLKAYFEATVQPLLPLPPEDYLTLNEIWKGGGSGGYWYLRLVYQFPFIRPIISTVEKAFENAKNCIMYVCANEAETNWPSMHLLFHDDDNKPIFSIFLDLNVGYEGSTCRRVKIGEQTVVQDIYIFECNQE